MSLRGRPTLNVRELEHCLTTAATLSVGTVGDEHFAATVSTPAEHHLRRLLQDYVAHCHGDRPHLSLGKETPNERPRSCFWPKADVVAQPRLGGLHHRYELAA